MISIKSCQMAIRIRNGETTYVEIADYLLKNYNSYEIALSLAEAITNEARDAYIPIPITEEQLSRYFRVIGRRISSDGEYINERRGRKKGTRVINGKVISIEPEGEGLIEGLEEDNQ